MTEARRVFPVEVNPTGPFPLLIGLEGPPGGGKTYSALRLARGIQQVRPGPIRLVDTEAGRSAAYRAQVNFGLIRLDPPYRPTRFLACIKELIAVDNPAAIIIDSLSDEHEGEGGVLEWHEEEVTRRLGKDKDNWARREAMSMAGWIVPKAARNQLVGGILRITTPVIFTFRAREKTRPVRDPQTGKTVPTKLGYQAIAPAEICHAMTAMCLLPPHADGKPIWRSEEAGQDFLLKRPNFLADILTELQLDETTGARLATWAQGTGKPKVSVDSTADHGLIGKAEAEVSATTTTTTTTTATTTADVGETATVDTTTSIAITSLQAQARKAAALGKTALSRFCKSLTKKEYAEAVIPIVPELERMVKDVKETPSGTPNVQNV